MTTASTTLPRHAGAAAADLSGAHLSFAHLVRAEWIKLRSLRSTWWCLGLIVLVTLGIGLLAAFNVGSRDETGAWTHVVGAEADQYLVLTATVGMLFTQLIAAVLGVLVIGGEYGTGMIRASFSAAPGRLSAVFAKALVIGATTFVASLIATWLTAGIGYGILHAHSIDASFGDWKTFMPLLGASVYTMLITSLAFFIGLVLRNSAGGIATALGLLLIAPIIGLIVYGLVNEAAWLYTVDWLLPLNSGGQLFSFWKLNSGGGMNLAPLPPIDQAGHIKDGYLQVHGWLGFGILAAWNVVVGGIAAVLVKRRDA